jgi:hypothetical protein
MKAVLICKIFKTRKEYVQFRRKMKNKVEKVRLNRQEFNIGTAAKPNMKKRLAFAFTMTTEDYVQAYGSWNI